MSLKDALNKAKHLVVDDEPDVPSPPTKVSNTPVQTTHSGQIYPLPQYPPNNGATTINNTPLSVPSSVSLDPNVYQQVFDKTDFDKTDIGKVIHKYFDALEGAGLDTSTRFKSAITQASKLDGIGSANILDVFGLLQAQLQKEVANFNSYATSNEKQQISDRQDKIKSIEEQVAALNQQRTQLISDLSTATADHSNAVQQFNMAVQRRTTEIEQQKAQFTSFLQH